MYGHFFGDMPKRTIKLIYNRETFLVQASYLIEAINELGKIYPELLGAEMTKLKATQVGVDAYVVEFRQQLSFEYVDQRNIDPPPHIGIWADLFIEQSIAENNEKHMLHLIDQALADKNKDEFLRLTAEYKKRKELVHA